jgi:hypothetical protein
MMRRLIGRVRTIRAEIHGTRAQADRLVTESERLAAQIGALRTELAASRTEVAGLAARLDALAAAGDANHQRLLDALRVVRDDDARARAALWELRESDDYAIAFDDDEPLVTIIVTTYRNWPLLRERSLPSVLAQTYERIEVIVIGDAAPPDAEEVVRRFGDKRVRFVNLPYRGPYPTDPASAWLVTGTTPYNTGLALARGRWIASNSDDDALRPNHVETLLALARAQRAEVPYGRIHQCEPDSDGTVLGGFPPEQGNWSMQSSLMHAGLRFLPLQPTDWIFGVPNDVSLLERMLRIGVRFAFSAEPVVDYYPSSLWTDRLQRTEF